jgi:maltose-binding protein MalE
MLTDYFTKEPIAKQQIEEIVPYGIPEPSVAGEQEIRGFMEEAAQKVFEDLATPQEALDEAVKKSNEALARGRQ